MVLGAAGPRAGPEFAAAPKEFSFHSAPGAVPQAVPVAAGLPSYGIKCSCNSLLTAVSRPL